MLNINAQHFFIVEHQSPLKEPDSLTNICNMNRDRMPPRSLREIFFQLQDSCLADCKFLLVKRQFCKTVLYVIIVILEIFAGHLFDGIKYFVSQNEILLDLTDRPALFVKIVLMCTHNLCFEQK